MMAPTEKSLPAGWTWASLGDLIRVIRGVTYKKEDAQSLPSEGYVPILRATNIEAQLTFDDLVYVPQRYVSEDQYLRPGDVVLAASSGSKSVVGKAAPLCYPWPGSFGAFCFALRPYSSVTAPYLALFLQSTEYRNKISQQAAGININNIRAADLEAIAVPIAPVAEQERIVATADEQLMRLRSGVATLQRVKANLKRYRAAVLKAACEGHLTATEPLLASNQLVPWPIPRRWRWVKAEEISHFITKGTTPAADSLTQGYGEIPFIKVQNLTFNGSLDVSINRSFIPKSVHNSELRRSIVFPGDVLMNIVGPPLGKVALVPTTYPEWNINQAIARFRPKEGIKAAFLSLVLQNNATLRWAERRAKATAGQFNLTLEICRELPVPVPPEEEQVDIVAVAERHLAIIDSLSAVINRSLVRASNLRQALLRQAFEGVLVPQDPNDEPASVLLRRIREARTSRS